MSDEDEVEVHIPVVQGEIVAGYAERHKARMEWVEAHMGAARDQVSVLVARTRVLVRNGVDLRHPERVADFVDDQVFDAVKAATVYECGCAGAQGAAAAALLAELAHQLAVVLEERDR